MEQRFKQNYGPLFETIPDLSELGIYIEYAEQAFILAQKLAGNDPKDWDSPESRVLNLLNYHSLNTSYSFGFFRLMFRR